jgi:hypothetical protein
MIRVASQLTFCSPTQILRRSVVELDEHFIIKRLFSIDDSCVESAHTLFYDGILSAEIISLKESVANLKELFSSYNYIDFSTQPINIAASNKPLILDFGSSSIVEINKKINQFAVVLKAFSIMEIIAACCYFPAKVLGEFNGLSVEGRTGLVLWEGVDLVNKQITEQTRIRKIS